MRLISGLLFCVFVFICGASASAQIKAQLPQDKPANPVAVKPKVKQAAAPAKPSPAKPSLTKAETFNYIRGKLFLYNTKDGNNGYTDIQFDEPSGVISAVIENGGYLTMYFGNLDANNVTWDIYDPNLNGANTFDKLLRITITAKGSEPARQYFEHPGDVSPSTKLPNNIARLLFSLPKTSSDPDFQTKMTKAVKTLIALCGGEKERKDPFSE